MFLGWAYFSVLEEIWIRQNTWPPLAGLIFATWHIEPHEFCCYFCKVGLRFSTLGGVRYLQFSWYRINDSNKPSRGLYAFPLGNTCESTLWFVNKQKGPNKWIKQTKLRYKPNSLISNNATLYLVKKLHKTGKLAN